MGDSPLLTNNNTGPYVRRRSGAGVSDTSPGSTLVSVTTSLPPVSSTPTTNVTVTSSNLAAEDSSGGKRRSNVPPSRDEEAEAQRKHRSAQARRERRSTQSVTVEDIKAAEQQIKNRPTSNDMSPIMGTPTANVLESSTMTLANNKIGAPSTPSTGAEHDVETERLQRVIEEKKDKARRASGGNEVMSEQNFNLDKEFIIIIVFDCFGLLPLCLFVQLTSLIIDRHLR